MKEIRFKITGIPAASRPVLTIDGTPVRLKRKGYGFYDGCFRTEKEVAELRRRFRQDRSGISHIRGCYVNENREILACALANGAAALTGSCPVNGSISRTSMNDQYGGHTQLVSVVAGIVMLALLFTGTGFIEYLPVPVLTAIVICALMKVVEVHLALWLWKVRKRDFWIFVAAMLGVLFLGTVYGVVIGMLLSFIVVITEVIVEVTNPPPGPFWEGSRRERDFTTYRSGKKPSPSIRWWSISLGSGCFSPISRSSSRILRTA